MKKKYIIPEITKTLLDYSPLLAGTQVARPIGPEYGDPINADAKEGTFWDDDLNV